MAKSTKKPNSFSKGMQSDIDPNVLPPESYKSAINARLFTREDNSFVIKNAKGNTLLSNIQFNTRMYIFTEASILSAATAAGYVNPQIRGFTLSINGVASIVNYDTIIDGSAVGVVSFAEYLSLVVEDLNTDPDIYNNASISSNSGTIIISDQTTENITIATARAYILHDGGYDQINLSNSNDYSVVSFPNNTFTAVAMAEFSDYLAVFCTTSQSFDSIVKVSIGSDGNVSEVRSLLNVDLGLSEKTSLRVETSEENEHFHRVYWTDGINPLRTINLKEDPSFYSSYTGDDFNVFKDSNLPAPEVTSINSGGTVLCGSHSYCYRLVTTDGKVSKTSGITNPIHIAKGTESSLYHEYLGGSLSTESSNSVSVSIDNIDESYTSIQLINVRYVSKEGAIEANIISESIIAGSSFNYVHNGNEATISVPIGELLKRGVSWDTCATIAKKDNRLLAFNLTNNAESIDKDFRVKSYRYEGQGGLDTGTYTGFVNPDINDDEMYLGNDYAYLNRPWSSKVFGAETPDFDNVDDGVRVTFRTKTFDLSKVRYFDNGEAKRTGTEADESESTVSQVPHYGFLDRTGEGNSFNNYKNPLFAEKYVGYQRGEVYRFGILFYDKGGNPTFVSPIGDVRMPDGDVFYSDIVDGSKVSTNPEGVRTYKHAGNIPKKISGWDSDGTTTITNADTTGVNVGDLVSGFKIVHGTYVTAVNSGNITLSTATESSFTNQPMYFDDPRSDVYGFALYPHFEVKLSNDTLSKIGGYSIVRVDRKDKDKSVLASGVLNQIQIYSNNDGNRTLRHYNGSSFSNPWSPRQIHHSFSDSTFLFDSPESTLGKLNYSSKVGDKIRVVGKLEAGAQDFNDDNIPNHSTSARWKNLKQYYGGDFKDRILAGRFDPKSNDHLNIYQHSMYSIYSQYYSGVTTCEDVDISDKVKSVDYGSSIGPSEKLSSDNIGYDAEGTGAIDRPFFNRSRFSAADDTLYVGPTSSSNKFNSEESVTSAFTVEGVETNFIKLGETSSDQIQHTDFNIGDTTANINAFVFNAADTNLQWLYAQKLYAQVRRDVSDSRYGGNSESAFEKNQYIAVGHENFNPSNTNHDDVFGGDTFINMYSLQKWKAPWSYESNWAQASAAIVFPVESTVNIDLRDGLFFGSTDDNPYKVHDDFLMNETYSCRNTSKTFVQKPSNFKDVNNYGNMVAASNLKLNGDLYDAFSSWDANEIHELDASKGPIYNAFNLRNEIFTVQSSGVAKLSINPRVVVDNSDAQAVTIATGTGRVIERSDYIDTLYGSQHFNNSLVTNTAAYWFDASISSLCKLVYGQGVAVQDLGITTQNANIFNALKDEVINDKPLDYDVGGISFYHDELHDEVGVCITLNDGSITHFVYSELNDTAVTKKKNLISLAANLNGELISIGRNSSQNSINASNLWKENSNSAGLFYGYQDSTTLELEFVCNENVYNTKAFDKITMYLSGNGNTSKFSNFTFTDSIGTSLTNDGSLTKMSNGKEITPIVNTDGSGKAKGAYLIIKAQSTETGEVEVFGAITHNRVKS